jgi:cell division transport system permease protein
MSDLHMDDEAIGTGRMSGLLPRNDTPIVPKHSIAGRALVAVIAIMTFLASLTTGGVMLIWASANEWQSDIAREITIQVRPVQGRDLEADVRQAADIARASPGIGEVRPYSKEESARLLEPWFGSGLALDDLPVPRLIVVRLAPGRIADFVALRRSLAGLVPSASVDDHRSWIDRMRAMAHTSVIAGIVVLILVLVATMLSVAFATRGAMATNRAIVEVLHFVGAKDGFIAGQFQRHFLVLGLEGGLIGGAGAILLFALAGAGGRWMRGTAGGDQLVALFGTLAIGIEGYLAVLVVIVVIAAVTALASRRTVNRTLGTVE